MSIVQNSPELVEFRRKTKIGGKIKNKYKIQILFQGFTVDQTLDLEEYRKLKKPQLGINPDNQLEFTDPNEVLESNFGTPEPDSGSSVSEESFSEFVIT